MAEYETNTLLEKLGLTEYEAKTLSTLFTLKEAQATEISRKAQVPKTRVYDVLDRLTSKNLVIEIHGRPKKYRVIEPSKVFSILLTEKKKELEILEKESLELQETIMTDVVSNGKHEKVMKVKDRKDFMKILGQEIDSANKSVVAFTGVGKEHALIKDYVKKAVKERNVEVKLISRIANTDDKIAKEYTEAGIDLKAFDHSMNAYIIDGKKVVLALSDFAVDKPEYHFTIWPNNPDMAGALTKYFEHAWQQGKKI
ncbi:MAG TPA: helix-turn-helix domain-containing protein [archaeon]|nr:helix-turn-helix domain-containing protein [archaeon]